MIYIDFILDALVLFNQTFSEYDVLLRNEETICILDVPPGIKGSRVLSVQKGNRNA